MQSYDFFNNKSNLNVKNRVKNDKIKNYAK